MPKFNETFIVECSRCKARVGVTLAGRVEAGWCEDEGHEICNERIDIGKCPRCGRVLAGYSQTYRYYSEEPIDWPEVTRIFPHPGQSFSSYRIPKVVRTSLTEADRCLQVGASTAACAMMGRAVEGACRHLLKDKIDHGESLMLGKGIELLKTHGLIDSRLYEWSKELHAFRNMAAHPDEFEISRQDAEDLLAFTNALVEYVYDLADRYNEFRSRNQKK